MTEQDRIEREECEQLQRAQRGDLQAMLAEAYWRGYAAAEKAAERALTEAFKAGQDDGMNQEAAEHQALDAMEEPFHNTPYGRHDTARCVICGGPVEPGDVFPEEMVCDVCVAANRKVPQWSRGCGYD